MTTGTYNEILYALMQEISPDVASTINEEIIEAAIEAAEIPADAQNVNAALMALAYEILGITTGPGEAKNALVADAASAAPVADALRETEAASLRETEDSQLRRTE